MQFLFGADPELFVFNKDMGEFVSAHGMVKGSKEEPEPVDNGAVQVDGMALEFNISPATNAEEFYYNINHVRRQLSSMIDPILELKAIPAVEFSKSIWDQTPDEAKVLGCTPDYNAWVDGVANIIADRGDSRLRTGAGHIHIGWTNGEDVDDPMHLGKCMSLVRQLDASLGMASLMWDADTQRRSMYGNAGAFRPKPYGVEYRVLSNRWLDSKDLIQFVFNTANMACHDLVNGISYVNSLKEDIDIVETINNSIVPNAVKAMSRLGIQL